LAIVYGGLGMSVYAVVAVKGSDTSKKRLSPVLNPQERTQLTLAMLEDVLNALQASTINKTVIVSNDFTLGDFAGKFNAQHLVQKAPGLNPAVEEATEWCVQQGAKAVLMLPADIPLFSSADVDKIVELGNGNPRTVVLCRSYDGGTNALFQSPPNLIHACFGPRSFSKHVKEAQRRKVCLKLHYSIGVATDIDSVEDLAKMLKTEGNTACRRVLDQFKLYGRL
jgi:2-phospho-L-lactate guanylyltransferase